VSPIKSRDASYREILWPLVLGDALGRLEWTTGVLSLNVSKESYDSMKDAGTVEKKAAIATYTHEMVHVLQLALHGFPYRWAAELFELVTPAVVRLRAGHAPEDFGPLLDAIKLGEAAFTSDEVEAITAHFDLLDDPCPAGITTRSLLESHAHVVQRRINFEIDGFADLAWHLADAPAPEYRAAFDALQLAVGPEVAYAWFPLVCSVALCTERPAMSFNHLLLTLAAEPGYLPDKPTPENALQAQRDLADIVDSELIGSAGQVARARGEGGAPVLRLVDAANKAFSRQDFDPSWAYAAPHEELERLVPHLYVPVFLRPVDPQGFAAQLPPDMDQVSGLAYLTMAALLGQLTRSIEAKSRERGKQALDELDWLRWDRRPILMRLDAGQIAEHDHSRLLWLSDPASHSETSGRELARIWGRVALLAPEELDPDGNAVLATLPPVRDHLRTLSTRFPAFPVVLTWQSGMSGFVDWFGALVPHAMQGDALVLQHPDVLASVNAAADAIQRLGREVEQNPTLAIQLMQLPLLTAGIGDAE